MRSKIDCSDALITLIEKGDRRVYLVAVLCFLLGYYNNKKIIQLLWDHFHYFNKHYKNESYSDGPFLALKQIYSK